MYQPILNSVYVTLFFLFLFVLCGILDYVTKEKFKILPGLGCLFMLLIGFLVLHTLYLIIETL